MIIHNMAVWILVIFNVATLAALGWLLLRRRDLTAPEATQLHTTIEESLERADRRLLNLENNLTNKTLRMHNRVDGLMGRMDHINDNLSERLEGVHARLDKINERLDQV